MRVTKYKHIGTATGVCGCADLMYFDPLVAKSRQEKEGRMSIVDGLLLCLLHLALAYPYGQLFIFLPSPLLLQQLLCFFLAFSSCDSSFFSLPLSSLPDNCNIRTKIPSNSRDFISTNRPITLQKSDLNQFKTTQHAASISKMLQ